MACHGISVTGNPLRVIVSIEKKPFGLNGGHIQVFHLSCGHSVEHIQRYELKVGKRTGCPECR